MKAKEKELEKMVRNKTEALIRFVDIIRTWHQQH